MDNYSQSQEKTIKYFEEFVKPCILKFQRFQGARIMRIEGGESVLLKILDQEMGIDYLIKMPDGGWWGLAGRIQFKSQAKGKFPYNTFTIRSKRETGAKTELEKLTKAIKNGYLGSYWGYQAYIDDTTLPHRMESLAIAREKDKLDIIKNGLCELKRTNEDQIGKADFNVISWNKMKEIGCEIYIYPKDLEL